MITNNNFRLLANYGITLKKESKAFAIIKLYNKEEDVRLSRNLYDKLLNAISSASSSTNKLPKTYFGVELEFVGSISWEASSNFDESMHALLKESYFNCASSYQHNDGKIWILGRDGSIRWEPDTKIHYPYGYELSSSRMELFNEDDMSTLKTILDLVKNNLHAEVNESCGTHIHIGFDCKGAKREDLKNLLCIYAELESKVFDPIVPRSRRRNKYCRHTTDQLRAKYQKLSSRYCSFNLFSRDCCKNIHLESRQLEGTLDFNTIKYWAIFQATILYDILCMIIEYPDLLNEYRSSLKSKNIFDILFSYNFDNDVISFFIDRVIQFKSRTI